MYSVTNDFKDDIFHCNFDFDIYEYITMLKFEAQL